MKFPGVLCILLVLGAGFGCKSSTTPKSQPEACDSTADTLDFGKVTLGSSRILTVALRNCAAAPKVASLRVTNERYRVVDTVLFEIPPRGSHNFTVEFAPTLLGSEPCTLFTGIPSPSRVLISGVGTRSGFVGFAFADMVFDTTAIGTHKSQHVSVSNSGEGYFRGDLALANPDFQVDPTTLELPPNSSRLLTVTFVPTRAGPSSGVLGLLNVPDRVVNLSGSGYFPPAAPQGYLAFGSEGSGPGQFGQMAGVAIGRDEHVYAVDYGNDRVEEFTSEGQFVRQLGGFGSHPGEFNHPWGIAVDSAGVVYVADQGNQRVVRYGPDGNWIGDWAAAYGATAGPVGIAVAPDQTLWVTDTYNGAVRHYTADGAQLGLFHPDSSTALRPVLGGIAVSRAGELWITNRGDGFGTLICENPVDCGNRVERHMFSGRLLARFGGLGTGPGQFASPSWIAVDGYSGVFVSDAYVDHLLWGHYYGYRVQRLSSDGAFQQVWGNSGGVYANFAPAGLAVSPSGYLYVADGAHHRVLRFLASQAPGRAAPNSRPIHPIRSRATH